MKYVISLLIAGFIAFSLNNVILAQPESTSITAFPAVFEEALDPGQVLVTSLVVVNNSDKPLPVELDVESLIPADQIIDLSKRNDFDASRWITFSDNSLALEPKETKRVEVTIKVPNTAKAGGRYAEILVKELRLQSNVSGLSQAQVVPQIKVPLLINVNGESKQELIIEASDKFPGFIGRYSSLQTSFEIANTGTIHLLPTIKIVASKSGQVFKQYEYSPGIILPNTKKPLNINWQPDLPIGFYEINIEAVYGETNQSLATPPEKAFVFFPLWAIFGLFAISVTTGYLVAKRHNIKRAIVVLKTGKKA